MALDSLGRYQLVDIQDRVRRLLDALSFQVDPSSGAESDTTIQDQLISNTDIINQVNESLTGLWTELVLAKPRSFSQFTYISIEANNPGPYGFPPNMLGEPRWLKWKSPGIAFNCAKPEDWLPMQMVEDPNDYTSERAFGEIPTWRYDGDGFRLNRYTYEANPQGIQVNFMTLPPELTAQTSVIQVPLRYVRIMQQVVIYDAAYTLAFSKKKQVTDELSKKRDEWHLRLNNLAESQPQSGSIQMIAPTRMQRSTFSGRMGAIRGSNW
jgi:hypothetical protein